MRKALKNAIEFLVETNKAIHEAFELGQEVDVFKEFLETKLNIRSTENKILLTEIVGDLTPDAQTFFGIHILSLVILSKTKVTIIPIDELPEINLSKEEDFILDTFFATSTVLTSGQIILLKKLISFLLSGEST